MLFPGVSQDGLIKMRRNVKRQGAQLIEPRPDLADQTGFLSLQKKAQSSHERLAQGRREPARGFIVQEDEIRSVFQGQGNRFTFAGAERGLENLWADRVSKRSYLNPIG
jgi:hypothetical protein